LANWLALEFCGYKTLSLSQLFDLGGFPHAFGRASFPKSGVFGRVRQHGNERGYSATVSNIAYRSETVIGDPSAR
jgi:hypothetical protein